MAEGFNIFWNNTMHGKRLFVQCNVAEANVCIEACNVCPEGCNLFKGSGRARGIYMYVEACTYIL